MSFLLHLPRANTAWVQQINTQNTELSYVGFAVRDMVSGQHYQKNGDDQEYCLVLLSGQARFQCDQVDYHVSDGRRSMFDHRPPYAMYVPMNTHWAIEALSDIELAICHAPGIDGRHQARMILPEDMPLETRGKGSNIRQVCNILPETEPADSLLVVEVITPSGNWSSYPPHKHDTDNLPCESLLEETYYHRLNPPQGYVHQRVYTDDRSLDETVSAPDRSVVAVPRGYHPVGVPYGYESYYLNVMAGPRRVWKFRNDPDHEWVLKA